MAARPSFARAALLAALLAPLSPSCRAPARSVVLYTSVDQPHAEAVLRAFEAESGVRVLAVFDVEASKTTGLVQRLRAEGERPRADVFWSSEVVQTVALARAGRLAPYRSPLAADVPPSARDPQGLWTGMGLRARVLLVNTGRVGPGDEPRRLDDLLSPRWKPGEVGLALPLFGTSATHAAALAERRGPEQAEAFFVGLRERGARFLDGNSVVRDRVVSGDLAVGLTDTDDAGQAERRGAPVRTVVLVPPDDGALFIPGTVAVVAGAPHPAEARALVDFLVRRRTEEQLVAAGFLLASVRDLPAGAEVDWGRVADRFEASQRALRERLLR